jgi:hypothetical protein
MHNISITALMVFAVAPFVAFSIRTHTTHLKAKESERAWNVIAKFIV